MAKTTNCSLCGKELSKGFLSGDNYNIDVGPKVITCCEDCLNKYKPLAKENKKRFTIKYENLKKATKGKYSEQEIGNMFLTYLDEKNKQYEKIGDVLLTNSMIGFSFNYDGLFSVREFGKGFSNQDISVKDMIKSYKKAENTDCHVFDINDITKIEYAKNGSGTFLGLIRKVYSFNIRLNDEKIMTYKPCITRAATIGMGFMFGYQKSAEKQLVKALKEFSKHIGCNLPIVKVNKI